MKKLYSLILLNLLLTNSLASNILFISLLDVPSHHIWNEILIGELLKNGHNVTILTHYMPKIKSDEHDHPMGFDLNAQTWSQYTSAKQIYYNHLFQLYVCEKHLNSDVPLKLFDYPKQFFDVILFDVGAGHCHFPIVDHFGETPVVGVSPYGTPSYVLHMMGYRLPDYIPVFTTQYTDKMTLIERTHNYLLDLLDVTLYRYYRAIQHGKSKEYFQRVKGLDVRDFRETAKRIKFLLTNNDPIMDFPTPFPPHIIPVGGLHVRPAKKLDGDLKKILDGSKDGVIYFSMGSLLTAENFDERMRNVFVDVFGRFDRVTVLWKFEDASFQVPGNVLVKRWYPQSDVLAHENVKLYISHCGSLGLQESIYRGVPVLGIPILVDQHTNAAKVVSKGIGKSLNYHELTKDSLYEAINSILTDGKYKEEVMKLSRLVNDRQVKPLDEAIFWIEYIVRRKGDYLDNLSSVGRHFDWYELYGVDVLLIGFLLCAGLIICCFILKAIKCFCFYSQKRDKIKQN